MALNEWVDSFPTEFDLPEPTEAYKKGIEKLMDKMRGDRYHKLTRSAARGVLIAAILLAIATVTLAATVGREFIVEKFSNYSTYNVVDSSNVESVDDINIGYIPEGFEFSSKEITDFSQHYIYNNNGNWLIIYKSKISNAIDFDTEHENIKNINVNSFDGIYYENSSTNYSGIIWNNGNYVYTVEGNITEKELTKIAENIT